jgi:hypothetical protein
MSRPDRVLILSLLVALAAASTACGGTPSGGGASCSSDEECRSDARCSSRTCVVNTPPVADFAIAGDLHANAIVTLDGSTSRDPDLGDDITSYSWSVASENASCDPPSVAGTEAVVKVRFGCAGRFQARLVVLDGRHVESLPSSKAIEIDASSAPGVVQAGPDQTVGHACSGSPPTCRLVSAVQLGATTTAAGPVTFHWSVQPPKGRELDAHRRVRFQPDASAANPVVEIETDGTAISGDWLFRVEVQDGLGVLDAAVTRVSVTNRPPTIHGGPSGSFPHGFDPATSLFTSRGTFPVTIADEDGDPLVRELASHHTADGGAVFQAEDLGTAVRFAVAVPYDTPSSALWLRGGEGLARTVTLTATDANGGTASAAFSIDIADQPPVMLSGGEQSPTHTYDPVARVFLSQPAIGRWGDPDGDPLTYAIQSDPECSTSGVQGNGTVQLRCSRPFTTMSSLAGFLQERKATVVVSDPWGSIASSVTFRIGNRPPVVNASTFAPRVACEYRGGITPLCRTSGSGMDPPNLFPATVVSAPVGVSDPDGDPVEVTPASGAGNVQCFPGQPCNVFGFMPQSVSCDPWPPDFQVAFAASDGVGAASGSVLVSPICR